MTDENDSDPPPPNGNAVEDDWFGDADPRVPDAPQWPERDLRFLGDDVFLGEEATMPPISPTHDAEAELRELERRMEHRRALVLHAALEQIGRASCRERV